MSQGELLDGAFGLYRRHFRQLVGVSALCYGPFQAFNLFAQISGGWIAHPVLLAVALLALMIGSLVGAAAILKIISDGYLEREASWDEAIRYAMGKVWPLIVAGFAAGVLTALATLLFIIPGIIVACGYSVVRQVVVLEDLPSATDALGRSWSLTKGHRMTALTIAFVLALVSAVPGAIAGVIAAVTPFAVVGQVLAALFAVLLSPLVPCGMTLYYYDLRVRKEAFDLQLLGQLLGPSA
ncbi:MAG: hypothetical protein ACHQU8_00375 [Gemmatimonadales bacterium]